MSDFLTRLAERTLGLASVVEPVLPSMFAPVLEAEPFEEAPEELVASASPEARVTFDVRGDSAQTTPSDDARVTGIPSGQPPADAPRVGRAPAGDLVPVPANQGQPEQPSAPLEAAAPAARPPGRADIEPLVPAFTNLARDIEVRATSAPQASSAESALPRVASALTSMQPLVAGTRAPEADPGVATSPRAVRAEPPGPTVRITIGRVEVRAVTPPQPAERPRREPTEEEQRLSLSDYLKRGGGAR